MSEFLRVITCIPVRGGSRFASALALLGERFVIWSAVRVSTYNHDFPHEISHIFCQNFPVFFSFHRTSFQSYCIPFDL